MNHGPQPDRRIVSSYSRASRPPLHCSTADQRPPRHSPRGLGRAPDIKQIRLVTVSRLVLFKLME